MTSEKLRSMSKNNLNIEQTLQLSKSLEFLEKISARFGILTMESDEELENDTESLSFSEKKRLFSTEYPHKVSSRKREKGRKALKYIARNPQKYNKFLGRKDGSKSSSQESSKPIESSTFSSCDSNFSKQSPRKWDYGSELSTSEFSKNVSEFSTACQDLNLLSKSTFDAAYANKTQSLSTMNLDSNPFQTDSEFDTGAYESVY